MSSSSQFLRLLTILLYSEPPKKQQLKGEAGVIGVIFRMEMQMPAVKATLCLGSETHSIEACKGILSEQLVFVKGESMNILKEFITTHNVPIDVPDEVTSEDDDGDDEAPTVKSKKVRT
ncbi:hypothetical protein HanXRQr2_Chr11g0496771 [Helianthus annuus]|uniref:Uncharacterized protein n=1 Tax=Helianthus annuus TaxID=4232 RepID=A0A9K3HQA0_HELAN|nr:hypothetical protein HanXRQr2_Chr11g0496771 [Helianthus annuus]KAJ0875645.1 hypothetical protein HanPSC8_Chr11g0478821 [Helianthus annuus]